MTPTPPNFRRRPDPDHSVDGPALPAVWPPPRVPAPDPGPPWWVRLIRLAARLARWLLRRGN